MAIGYLTLLESEDKIKAKVDENTNITNRNFEKVATLLNQHLSTIENNQALIYQAIVQRSQPQQDSFATSAQVAPPVLSTQPPLQPEAKAPVSFGMPIHLASITTSIGKALGDGARDLAATTAIKSIFDDVTRSKASSELVKKSNDFTEAMGHLRLAKAQRDPDLSKSYLEKAEDKLTRVLYNTQLSHAQRAVAGHYAIAVAEGQGKRESAKHFFEQTIGHVMRYAEDHTRDVQKVEQAQSNPITFFFDIRQSYHADRAMKRQVSGELAEMSELEQRLREVDHNYR